MLHSYPQLHHAIAVHRQYMFFLCMYLMYEFNNLHLEILTRRCWSFRLAKENLIQCSLLKINGFRLLHPQKLEGQIVYRSIPGFCQYADAPSMYGYMIYIDIRYSQKNRLVPHAVSHRYSKYHPSFFQSQGIPGICGIHITCST